MTMQFSPLSPSSLFSLNSLCFFLYSPPLFFFTFPFSLSPFLPAILSPSTWFSLLFFSFRLPPLSFISISPLFFSISSLTLFPKPLFPPLSFPYTCLSLTTPSFLFLTLSNWINLPPTHHIHSIYSCQSKLIDSQLNISRWGTVGAAQTKSLPIFNITALHQPLERLRIGRQRWNHVRGWDWIEIVDGEVIVVGVIIGRWKTHSARRSHVFVGVVYAYVRKNVFLAFGGCFLFESCFSRCLKQGFLR